MWGGEKTSATHLCSVFLAVNYRIVQPKSPEGRTQHVERPQDQLRQVRRTGSDREAVIPSSGNTALNNRHHSGGSTQTAPQRSNGVPSNVRRVFVVRKPNAEPNQKSNRGTTVSTNPKVQEQASGYGLPKPTWHQRPNQQSAVRNPLPPARTPAFPGRAAASQSGPGARPRLSNTVRATWLGRRRGARPGQKMQFGSNDRRRGAAQSRSSGTLVAQSFDDPVDPRYKQTINYVIPSVYGNVIIKRLKQTTKRPQQNPGFPQRRHPPRRQSQRVWAPRTRS